MLLFMNQFYKWVLYWDCKDELWESSDNNTCNTEQHTKPIYLNNAIDVKAHDKLWDITHQIVEPVVNSCQNVDWFIVVSEKNTES